ncbi:hypothetical protein C5N14_22390 [Micromonospora sp. MW-13]|nr:hypothetical protein C5N14_22390 [Micromonospora sp. MW-13]
MLAVSELSFGERARAKPRGVRPVASRPAPVRLPEPGRPAGWLTPYRPAGGRGQWPRAIHSSRCGASAPTVVLSPWPVCTTVSGGRVSSRVRIDSTMVPKSL